MMAGRVTLALVLSVAVTLSAVAVVYTKYQTRTHFSHLQDLRAQRDGLDVEWNRLRLEEAALSTHVRVERKARDQLGMFSPRLDDILLIEEVGRGTP
ncbi:cell division protein FtsL [Thiocapsa imhoffii]|uniref:Cell division protein FtsL n=1 Tax=Thiocapsa imhoffii TaxID=382777 RepID=A0A9X0WF40_9GAMM|nr:cell division protein FtsL [Thiocapsa imhoffii]MBK1643361.1 cell division protein FtsL [Thiocapsa imhoffii]